MGDFVQIAHYSHIDYMFLGSLTEIKGGSLLVHKTSAHLLQYQTIATIRQAMHSDLTHTIFVSYFTRFDHATERSTKQRGTIIYSTILAQHSSSTNHFPASIYNRNALYQFIFIQPSRISFWHPSPSMHKTNTMTSPFLSLTQMINASRGVVPRFH